MTIRHFQRRAFSRIELLALLLCGLMVCAILVPAGHAQRQMSSAASCESNLGQIARGTAQYGIDFDDWIVGSPNTSGAYLMEPAASPPGVAYGPAVQVWDFMGVLEQYLWGATLTKPTVYPGSQVSVAHRFDKLRRMDVFRCPENNFQAAHYSGPNAGTGPMVSYNTSRIQMWYQHLAHGTMGLTVPGFSPMETLPIDRAPQISTMGKPQNKVFCADGARYSSSESPPDYDLDVRGGFGGSFADSAPYDKNSASWDRSWSVGHGLGVDGRQYAFRHSIGTPPPGAPGNAYRLNLAFYDGHVETQGDLDASNPQQWLPMGTVLETSNCWADTRTHFGLGYQVVINP